MNSEIAITEALSFLMKICKENQYNELQEKLSKCYFELIKIEADTRRQKAGALIRGMQAIDRELRLLIFEYEKVKRGFNTDGIQYFDRLISEIKQKRRELAMQKEALK